MRHVAIAAVVFVVAMARSFADGVGQSDESWFLQVLSRLSAGDVLYKDVSLGVTPLSVYVTSWVTSMTGIEVVAVKLVTNACFAVTAFFAARIASAVGLSHGTAWTLAASMLVWGRPHGNPPYTAMAMAAFAAAAWIALPNAASDTDRASRRRWFAAGVACGLGIAAKQNVGVLALAAVALCARGARLSVLGGAVLAAGVVISPVLISGGWSEFQDYAVAAKGTYVASAGVSYAASVGEWLDGLLRPTAPGGWSRALHCVTVILPIASAIATALSWRRLDRRGRALAVFGAAATLTALPRWDRFHMAYAVPFHVLTIASALGTARRDRVMAPKIAVLAMPIAVVLVLAPAATLLANGHRPSTLAHFRGPLSPPAQQAGIETIAARFRDAAGGRPIFILDAEAGFWYLTTGLTNPTPFDIPAATSIGTGGVTWLLSRLADGRIDQVCLDESPPGPLALETVATFVRGRFSPGPDVGPCRIYRAPATAHTLH